MVTKKAKPKTKLQKREEALAAAPAPNEILIAVEAAETDRRSTVTVGTAQLRTLLRDRFELTNEVSGLKEEITDWRRDATAALLEKRRFQEGIVGFKNNGGATTDELGLLLAGR